MGSFRLTLFEVEEGRDVTVADCYEAACEDPRVRPWHGTALFRDRISDDPDYDKLVAEMDPALYDRDRYLIDDEQEVVYVRERVLQKVMDTVEENGPLAVATKDAVARQRSTRWPEDQGVQDALALEDGSTTDLLDAYIEQQRWMLPAAAFFGGMGAVSYGEPVVSALGTVGAAIGGLKYVYDRLYHRTRRRQLKRMLQEREAAELVADVGEYTAAIMDVHPGVEHVQIPQAD